MINQLRAEVQQWKAQLACIEDTSRQEVDSWKEQYIRTEHERARLSLRLEEMLAGQYAVRSFLLSVAAALTALRKSKAPIVPEAQVSASESHARGMPPPFARPPRSVKTESSYRRRQVVAARRRAYPERPRSDSHASSDA